MRRRHRVRQLAHAAERSGRFNEARTLVEQARPDIVLLDLRARQLQQLLALHRVARAGAGRVDRDVHGLGNEELLDQAITAGAVGYVPKDTSTAGLPEVLRTVRREGAYFDPRVANRALMTKRRGAPQHPPLSEREPRIVKMIADGEDNSAIAEELQPSVHMVVMERQLL
jgi:DNA-binding NarL/FixJ family response regulator